MALIEEHLSHGNQVLVIANPKSTRNHNFNKFDNIKIIYSSLNDYDSIKLDEKYDVFYHFAWQGGALRNNFDVNMNSALQAIKAVNLASRNGCTSFVGAGSQAECGIHETPISENTIVILYHFLVLQSYQHSTFVRLLAMKKTCYFHGLEY